MRTPLNPQTSEAVVSGLLRFPRHGSGLGSNMLNAEEGAMLEQQIEIEELDTSFSF
jgi:hypothetical protein